MISKKKLEERKRKWGTYLPEYVEREEIKHLVYNNNPKSSSKDNIEKYRDLYVYTYWSRSLEANDFDLEHPNFYEYKEYFKIKDVSWLRLGYSYVNMIAYKKWKRETKNARNRIKKSIQQSFSKIL